MIHLVWWTSKLIKKLNVDIDKSIVFSHIDTQTIQKHICKAVEKENIYNEEREQIHVYRTIEKYFV